MTELGVPCTREITHSGESQAEETQPVDAISGIPASGNYVILNESFPFVPTGYQIPSVPIRGQKSRFRVQGSGFRVQGSGFRVQGSGFWPRNYVVLHESFPFVPTGCQIPSVPRQIPTRGSLYKRLELTFEHCWLEGELTFGNLFQ